MTIKEAMKAYIAGLFDGEGCVRVDKQKSSARRKQVNPSYTLECSLASSNHAIVEFLRQAFGGGIYFSTGRGGRKDIWNWQISSRKAQAFLRIILPYLRIKKSEVEEAILFQEYVSKTGKTWNRNHPRPLSEIAILNKFYQSLKDMKGQDIDLSVVDFSEEKANQQQFQLLLN